MELNSLGMMGSLSSIWKQLYLEQSFFLAKISYIELTIFASIFARGLMLILNSGFSVTIYPTIDLLYRFCLLLWSYTSLCPLYSSYFRYFFALAVGFYLGVSKVGDGQAYFNYFCYYYPFVFLLLSQAFRCFLNALSRFSAYFLSSYSACQRQNVNKPTSQYQKPFIFLLTHQRQLSELKLKYSNLAKVKPLQYIYLFLSIFGYLKGSAHMKKQKKVAKPRTGKSKRGEVQRRQALKQLRRKMTQQANERFQQQLIKQKTESSSEMEPCFEPHIKKRKRVLINESINQQHSHEEWMNLRAQHVLANEQSHSKQQSNVVERVKTRQRSRSDEINY